MRAAVSSKPCCFVSCSCAAVDDLRSRSRVSRPIARPNSAGLPGPSPRQNGIRPGSPGAGVTNTRSCVMSMARHDDAPSQEHVARVRLEHHFLVELADPVALSFAAGQVHAVESAVGNGASIQDRESLRAFAWRDQPRNSVPVDARPQLRKLVRRIAGPPTCPKHLSKALRGKS